MKVGEQRPEPHKRYLVVRGGVVFSAIPCYGLHTPWWVVKTMDGEASPVSMDDRDEWAPLPNVYKLLEEVVRMF